MKIGVGVGFVAGLALAALTGCTPEINDAIAWRIANPPAQQTFWNNVNDQQQFQNNFQLQQLNMMQQQSNFWGMVGAMR